MVETPFDFNLRIDFEEDVHPRSHRAMVGGFIHDDEFGLERDSAGDGDHLLDSDVVLDQWVSDIFPDT